MTVAAPPDGIYRTKTHAYFDHGVGPIPGVTSVTKMLDKTDALVPWAKGAAARFAVDHIDDLYDHRAHWGDGLIVAGCPPCDIYGEKYEWHESARRWVASIPDQVRDAAAALGTRVHTAAENIANGIVDLADVDVAPFAVQYQEWRAAYRPAYHLVEYVGVNRTYGYAGTGDIIASIDHPRLAPGPWAIDIKSFTKDIPLEQYLAEQSRKGYPLYYPETGMQLAACARLEVVGTVVEHLPGDTLVARRVMDMDDIVVPVNYAVLLLARDGFRFIPYAVTEGTFAAFLACLNLHRWKFGEAKSIVGSAA